MKTSVKIAADTTSQVAGKMQEMAKVMQKNEETIDDEKTSRFKIEKELKNERKD